ncbi:glycine cleavage system protein GcvH [Enterococcus sp. HY326]|uniref:glycine cleavage system protein GcvH n=1 Tax=Enterococcus sp. HY326 TaxID=2971265 RepID=UPI00223E98E2|nr:glycine cleavage system protein GcvH [Enterococcus sp. HY326]
MSEIKFTKSHEWIKIDGDSAKIGVSDYAQGELGDIVYVDLPDIGDEIKKGANFADIESVKTASEIYSPVSGVVVAINEDLEDAPESINEKANDTWIIEVGQLGDLEDLLTQEEYDAYLKEIDD